MTQRFFIIKREPRSIESLPLVGRTSTRCDGALPLPGALSEGSRDGRRIAEERERWRRYCAITRKAGRTLTINLAATSVIDQQHSWYNLGNATISGVNLTAEHGGTRDNPLPKNYAKNSIAGNRKEERER